jgi:hypothetical protein
LKVPGITERDAQAFADALAACTALTLLDLTRITTFPFRSWQQLGPTLHTLALSQVGRDITFRLLADNMPALRELEFHIEGEPSQDGFIELVSRLRSLSLRAGRRPWDSVERARAWPLVLPNLELLLWWADGMADAVAVAVLRRAVSLRAVDVSHASALAAIAAGPVAAVDIGDPCVFAPLANVQTLTLHAVDTDAASLATALAAAPRASTMQLRWSRFGHRLWDFLRAVASAVPPDAGLHRVRRVRLQAIFCDRHKPDPKVAAPCIRVLFPRARYASFQCGGLPDVQLLPQSP